MLKFECYQKFHNLHISRLLEIVDFLTKLQQLLTSNILSKYFEN